MPRVFLSLYADSHDSAIEFYCRTIGLFNVAVDKRLTPMVRNVVLNYIGAAIPLSLVVVVPQGGGSPPQVRQVFSVELFHPNIGLARERLAAAGFAAEMHHVPLGLELAAIDPFGNRLYLTDKTYDSYNDED